MTDTLDLQRFHVEGVDVLPPLLSWTEYPDVIPRGDSRTVRHP